MQAPPVVTAQPMPVAYAQPMAAPQMAQQLNPAPLAYETNQRIDLANNPSKPFEKMSKKELRKQAEWDDYRSAENQAKYLSAWLEKYWTGNPYSRANKAKTKARQKALLWRGKLEREATLMRKYLGFSFTWTELAVGAFALFVGYHLRKVNKLMNMKQKVLRELKQYDCLGADGPTRNAACAGVIALRDELVTLAEESSVARWAVGLESDLQAYVPIAKPLDELPPEGKRFWDAVVGEWVA